MFFLLRWAFSFLSFCFNSLSSTSEHPTNILKKPVLNCGIVLSCLFDFSVRVWKSIVSCCLLFSICKEIHVLSSSLLFFISNKYLDARRRRRKIVWPLLRNKQEEKELNIGTFNRLWKSGISFSSSFSYVSSSFWGASSSLRRWLPDLSGSIDPSDRWFDRLQIPTA